MNRESVRRRLLVVAVAALIPFVALAGWAHTLAPAPWEAGVLATLALRNDPWGDLVRLINAVGELPVWAVLVAVLALVLVALRRLAAAALVGLSIFSDLAASAVKLVVERTRPETIATQHFFGPDSYSFPSGHVVRAVALAASLAWVLAPASVRMPTSLAAAFGGLLVMGYARVSLGVHWPTDTIGGALLGLGWFALTAALLAPDGAPRRETDGAVAA